MAGFGDAYGVDIDEDLSLPALQVSTNSLSKPSDPIEMVLSDETLELVPEEERDLMRIERVSTFFSNDNGA